MNEILCKRIYEPAKPADGFRILVDRLWPRGIRKETAAIDLWRKDIAPTAELRKWFAHTPERYEEFTERYRQELDGNPAAQIFADQCREKLQSGNMTLLYAAKSGQYNNASVLKQWLEKRIKSNSWNLSDEGHLFIGKDFLLTNSTRSQFYGQAEKVVSAEFEAGTKIIPDHIFSYCENLRSVIIPEGVLRIEESAFYGCRSLKEIRLPESLETIGEWAFQDCYSLESLIIPTNVKEIGRMAFCISSEGKSRKRIDVHPDNLHFASVDGVLFTKDMKELIKYPPGSRRRKYRIPKTVEALQEDCFSYAVYLHLIEIPDGLKRLGGGDFEFCERLREMHIPEGVDVIPGYEFFCCKSLEHLTLPKTLKWLGSESICNCTKLKELTIPSGFDQLEYAAVAGNETITELVIPEGITEINNSACYGNYAMKKVVIPTTVWAIWEKAFRFCTSLEEITIPENVEHITDDAFADCPNLKKIVLKSKKLGSMDWVPEGAEVVVNET